MEQLLNDFEQTLLKKSEEQAEPKKQSFRCSQLPICPVKWVMGEFVHGGMIPTANTFGTDWFAGFGTIAHLALQKWSAFHGMAYGDWECTHFNRKIVNGKEWRSKNTIIIRDQLGPVKCPKCGKQMIYKELELRNPETGLTGHVDLLIPYKDGFIIVDFKTAGTEKIHELIKPAIEYHNQVQHYWYELETYGAYDWKKKQHRGKLKIYGTAIFYVQRDNPFSDKDGTKVFLCKELDKNLINRNFSNFNIANQAIENGQFEKVVAGRLCKNRVDLKIDCPYNSIGCGLGDAKVISNLKEYYKSYVERD
jgi:hypothetical protein